MPMILIIFIPIVIYIIYRITKSYEEDKINLQKSKDNAYNSEWRRFVKYVESGHKPYNLDKETSKWIIDNKDLDWKFVEQFMPIEVKEQFQLHIIKNYGDLRHYQ
jgi:hypothetical protein